MRKIRIPAVLAAAAIPVCAAAAIITASQAAQASTTYHHPVGPAVVSSYSCTPYVTGYDRHGHPLMGKDCMVNVIFTGPSGAWTLYIQTPRREEADGLRLAGERQQRNGVDGTSDEVCPSHRERLPG